MKKLSAILLALAVILSLVACAGGGGTEGPREAELNVMMSFPQYMEQWEAYVKQFEAKMLAEENIKVKVNLEMPASGEYESILQARLSGDDAPDLQQFGHLQQSRLSL